MCPRFVQYIYTSLLLKWQSLSQGPHSNGALFWPDTDLSHTVAHKGQQQNKRHNAKNKSHNAINKCHNAINKCHNAINKCHNAINYGGPQVQSENLNIPVQKNKYQHKNIYFSTKRFISVPKNIFQSKKIYFSTKIYISIQKDLFQYKKKFSKKYKHIPSVFATRRQKGSESFKMADLNGCSKRSNHLLF